MMLPPHFRPVALGSGLALVVLGFLLAPSSVLIGAEASRIAPPEKTVLVNGLTLLYQEDGSSARTVMQIFIRGGKAADPEGKAGLSYLVTRLALEIPDSSTAQDIMSQSSRFSMTSMGDYCLLSLECLSEHFEAAVKVASELILDPVFSGIRIDRIKKFMAHQGRTEEDDAVSAGHVAALKAFFGGSGYGSSMYGTAESSKSIGKKDITGFFARYFVAKNMVFSVVSDLDRAKIAGLLEKHFKRIPAGEPAEVEAPAAVLPPEKNINIEKDTKQSYIAAVFPIAGFSARDCVLSSVLESYLGKGVGSRLWDLRTVERLAYNVNCQATILRSGGIVQAYLETENGKRGPARKALEKIFREAYERGLDEEEFRMTRMQIKGQSLRDGESKDAKARTAGAFEALGLGYDFRPKFFEILDSMKLEEVNSFVKETLRPEKAVWITIGPKALPQ